MADVSVRPAAPRDAGEIARIQIETWRLGYASILPTQVLESLSIDAVERTWQQALTEPPSPRHRLLVAQEQQWIVGFIAVIPAEDLEPDDPEPASTVSIGPLLVEPRWGRRGHGSRLLAAAVDIVRADGATRAIAWIPEADTTSRAFFASSGWAADGYARALDTGVGELREVRIHVSLEDVSLEDVSLEDVPLDDVPVADVPPDE